jgi:hypothetical protein
MRKMGYPLEGNGSNFASIFNLSSLISLSLSLSLSPLTQQNKNKKKKLKKQYNH